MLISHEIPKQLFPYHDLINDYPYVLGHLLMEDSKHYDSHYAAFYKKKLQLSSLSYLDNSAYELGHSIDSQILYELGEKYKPTHIVIPDAYGKMEETITLAKDYSSKYSRISTPKFFAVLQGKTTAEYKQCYEYYLSNPWVDIIGINFVEIEPGFNREIFLSSLLKEHSCFEKKIHLLGCQDPNEFRLMDKNLQNKIFSVDTSSPIIHGWNSNCFGENGCLYPKPKEKLADNLDIELSLDQLNIIFSNIKYFRNYFK